LRTLKSSFIPISDGFNSAYVTLTKLRPLSCHEQSYGEIWPWNTPQIVCVCVCATLKRSHLLMLPWNILLFPPLKNLED